MCAAVVIFFLLIVGKALFTAIARRGIETAEEFRNRRREEEEYEAEERERRRAELEAEQALRDIDTDDGPTAVYIKGRKAKAVVREADLAPEDDLDGLDEFDEEGMPREPKQKKKLGGFIDTLLRSGMGLEAERIADTPEYRKMKDTYGITAEEVEEIKQKESEEPSAGPDIDIEEDGGEPEDIVSRELAKKFSANTGIDVVKLHEHPRVTKTENTSVYMVDEEEEPGPETAVSPVTAAKPDAAKTAPAPAAKDKTPNNGAASFNTPEQIAKLHEEQAKKPEPPYVFPPISLLAKGQPSGKSPSNSSELKETVAKLQQTFESFGVGVTVTDATVGPTVTRYELLPDQGVKVKTITSLSDDIKLALAAAEIRIEAPIPGKAAVGIEVPNATTSPVLLRDLLDTPDFKDAQSKLTFAVGKDIGGKAICFDIGSMPHMLIAGATGSGKSVCINALILSILYKAKPSEVKMVMIDPKRVELIGYNGIPHLLVPVVTDVKKATGALNWAIAEMDDRYARFADAGVNNLKSYNRKIEEKYYEDGNEGECPDLLPQILIIVDELNDLMMTANSKEVEGAICRLTQLARASGIHVVLATQRPSVNVITGTIKANIPSRIAFSVSSIVDSRTILDQSGAEKLLGKGDMLFYPQGYPKPVRLQGAYVSDKEIAGVVDFIKSKCKEVKYNEKISTHIEKNAAADPKASGSSGGASGSSAAEPDDGHDEFFEQAGRLIIEKQKASIGMLQRVYKIGFNRAARIMDQLAEEGIVGPEEGTKPRRILMTLPEFEAYMSSTSQAGESDETDGNDEQQ
ncbi:MAG: DNA translocase FtsK [Lachnospiraceae bacterium]|nr:DNA translocase FtsK [Lachnospiraceae bacterium]